VTEERLTLSVEEAAAKLGISRNLGYQLAKTGQLPGVIRLGQRRIVISRVQFERFLAADRHRQEAPRPEAGTGYRILQRAHRKGEHQIRRSKNAN